MGVPELRVEVLQLCDILQAILTFNYRYATDTRTDLDQIRRDLPIAPARWLRQTRDSLRENVKGAVKHFGCKENPKKFAKWFKENSKTELGILLLPKVEIDKIFSNYGGKAYWGLLPPHLLVDLDFSGESSGGAEFHWRLPEASLYEDMCLAYNNASDSKQIGAALGVPVPIGKLHDCFLRTSVLSAFYFVEAYLNGVAFDYCSRSGNDISVEHTRLLMEWDQHSNREKWVSFREKILAYPKVILGLQHPPLTEGNSPEVKLLVSAAKEIRDAIVHQSPKADPRTGEVGPKVRSFLQLRMVDATEIVDAAISLVRQLNELLGQNGIMLDFLVGRDSTGKFPKKAFL